MTNACQVYNPQGGLRRTHTPDSVSCPSSVSLLLSALRVLQRGNLAATGKDRSHGRPMTQFPEVIRDRIDYRRFLELDLAAHGLRHWRFIYRLTRPELLFQRTLRAAEYYSTKRGAGRLLYYLFRALLKRRSMHTGIAISPGTCGPGLSVPHYGSVIVHRDAKIGAFCRIHSATNIGRYHGGAPRLGDFVYVGPGAVIYGDVTVGSRTVIGAGAVVGRSVPEDSTVLGSRCEIHSERPSSEVMPPWIASRMS